MRISAIQTKVYSNQLKSKVSQPKLRVENPVPEESKEVSFKGEGGAFYGMGLGALATMVAICTAPISIPAILGTAAIAGSAFGGAALGDKIENKLNGSDKE